MGLALAPVLAATPAVAQADRTRLALVVGNSQYLDSPLRNPVHDARAMARLLESAGCAVDLRTDTTKTDLRQAIERFGQALRDPRIQLAVFYYAGHGFQQDWRNFLVPVDARVRTASDVATETVEVGELVRKMGKAETPSQAKGRHFLVILDACRDDPFAGAYRPPAKGLIPFDAPVGSVLAYATAPGRVALDGAEGGNGLYTRHLLRELAVREASVEDAFKRVRLNVRLESRGQQVPWEMASLEDPVFLFPQQRTASSESELQQRFDAELAAWSRVRQANDVPALAEFIRQFPNGNASELAQARLNRLLADEIRRVEQQQLPKPDATAAAELADRLLAQGTAASVGSTVATASAATGRPGVQPPTVTPMDASTGAAATAAAPPAPVVSQAPALEVDKASATVPPSATLQDLRPPAGLAATPFFSGQANHWRDYRLGQRIEQRTTDRFNQSQKTQVLEITALDPTADRVEFNGGEYVSDLMGNTVSNPRGSLSTPRQFYPAEFVLGKRWQTEFQQARRSGLVYVFRYKVRVAGRETVTVPAGRFDTWRIEAEGFNVGLSAYIKRTLWVAPGVPGDIAAETFVRLRTGDIEQYDRQELVAVRMP
jgi:uncharacterized caspase-like protein